MESWSDQHIVHRGKKIVIDGSAFSAISRLKLLQELQALCLGIGVRLIFDRRATLDGELMDCDVLVGADGANSQLRDQFADAFGPRISDLQNYFAWYGVEQRYEAHTLTFESNADGAFCGHHYRYEPNMSTFVAEVDAETWHRSGMSAMDDEQRRLYAQKVFARTLGGKELISNRSIWKRWRLIKNDRWSFRNMVLIGDAQRSAHPSIGSGTRLAMEDSIVLWRALCEDASVPDAFARYERERRPVRDKLNRAA